MKRWLACLLLLVEMCGICLLPAAAAEKKSVYIVPIRDDIMPPLVYIVRRGVKEAMEAKADLLLLDMETNGGRVDVTEEIIEIINQFKGPTVTFVNRKAFSAGAFISFATQKIYMAPQSVIGAAAPIMMSPGGTGANDVPDTVEAKMTSAISALVRANAEKNGHNVEVVDAMVKKTKELKIDGKVLNEKGQILTLTDKEASAEYGNPAKPLLSLGTVESIDALLKELGYEKPVVTRIEPTGAERLGTWINAISPILLIIGVIAFYIEFKTPGFGVPGIIGLIAFTIYFLGGYIAGISGAEWIVVFIIGLGLMAFEIFIHPGTIVPGIAGVLIVFVALIMGMVDMYPGGPSFPTLPQLELPIRNLVVAAAGSIMAILVLARLLPKTPIYNVLVSPGASGMQEEVMQQAKKSAHLGKVGVTVSSLRPGGKAQFGDVILDVISQGDMVAKGQPVKIIGYSGTEAIVEVVA